MKTQPIDPTGMAEVIALENEIRKLVVITAADPNDRVSTDWDLEGLRILTGKPTIVEGTRLERLRKIALQLRELSERKK